MCLPSILLIRNHFFHINITDDCVIKSSRNSYNFRINKFIKNKKNKNSQITHFDKTLIATSLMRKILLSYAESFCLLQFFLVSFALC